jgi:hypothetical protein
MGFEEVFPSRNGKSACGKSGLLSDDEQAFSYHSVTAGLPTNQEERPPSKVLRFLQAESRSVS